MSANAKLLVITGFLMLLVGSLFDIVPLEVAGLSTLAVVAGEWVVFRWKIEVSARRALRLEREFGGARCDVVWLGDEVQMNLTLINTGLGAFPRLEAKEVLPPQVKAEAMLESWKGGLGPRGRMTWSYLARADRVGHASFPGLSVTLASTGGLFFDTVFIESPRTLAIFPPVFRRRTNEGHPKRHNRLRQHGLHVHRRAGLGAELLELRDYVPGDPPQKIAWRASARRENLVTRELESEVPMRVTLFLDVSASMRVEVKGGTLLDQAIPALAQFSRTALDAGDRVGLVLVDERGESVLKPGRGRTHLLSLMRQLTSAANLSPGHGAGDPERLFAVVEKYVEARYPHLLHPELNRPTAGLFSLRPWAAGRETRVKRIAAVATAALEEGPTILAQCLVSQKALADLLVRFAERESLRVGSAPVSGAIEMDAASAGRIEVMERSLRFAVRQARDSEFMVLYGNWAMLDAHLGPLVEACRVASARGHGVLVLGPRRAVPEGKASMTELVRNPTAAAEFGPLLLQTRHAESMRAAGSRFREAGVRFVEIEAEAAPAMLMAQLERLRSRREVPVG